MHAIIHRSLRSDSLTNCFTNSGDVVVPYNAYNKALFNAEVYGTKEVGKEGGDSCSV